MHIKLFQLIAFQKRRRREYRQMRKQQFKRPDIGGSLYEGRTRGKRIKYTYSDEEEGFYSDSTTTRRSTRNTGTHTPIEPSGPTVTQSGRQVKSRQGGVYGESMLSGSHNAEAEDMDATNDEAENEAGTSGRPRRAAAPHTNGWSKPKGGRHIEGYNNVDEMTSDEEADASEQDYGDDEEDEDDNVSLASDGDDLDDILDEGDEVDDEPKKLVIKLPVKTPTPERKTTVKLPLTAENDGESKPNGHVSNLSKSDQAPHSGPGVDTTSPVDIKENIQPSSENGSDDNEAVSKSRSIPPKSPQPTKAHLAFRTSPEKPQVLLPSLAGGS